MNFLLGHVHILPMLLICCQHTLLLAINLQNNENIGYFTHENTIKLQDHGNSEYYKDSPCPNTEDIAPCLCIYDEAHDAMDLNCDGISDEQELYDVFHADMPNPNFRDLKLNTSNIGALSEDVFGDATFEYVRTDIRRGILSSVDPNTFINSAHTLKYLNLQNNDLAEFPMYTPNEYTELLVFSLSGNPVETFPIIESEFLKELYLSHSLFETIPAGALDGLPNLEVLYTSITNASDIPIGLFTPLHNLKEILIHDNGYGDLKSLQFAVNSSEIQIINLRHNEITDIETDTFEGVQTGTIDLGYNQFVFLPEVKWRPLLEAGVTLKFTENPLDCACDVAWLVLEPSFHHLVRDAWCHDAQKPLVDLDPSLYENC